MPNGDNTVKVGDLVEMESLCSSHLLGDRQGGVWRGEAGNTKTCGVRR